VLRFKILFKGTAVTIGSFRVGVDLTMGFILTLDGLPVAVLYGVETLLVALGPLPPLRTSGREKKGPFGYFCVLAWSTQVEVF